MGMNFNPPGFQASTLGTAAYLTAGAATGNLPTVPIDIASMNMTGTTLQYVRGDGSLATFSTAAITAVTWSTLTGKPTFATVATSGAYLDLSGLPSLGTAAAQNTGAFDAAGAAAAAQAASQPLDSDLTAIAALSTTTFGRALLTSANAAAMLSTLGTTAIVADTGWTANSTAGDKTAIIAAFTASITGAMITALNTVSAGLGTALAADEATVALLVKKVAALETALVAGKLPNA